MNCEEFVRTLPASMALLDAEQEEHTAICQRCSALVASHRSVLEGLQALAQERSRQEAPPAVEARLVAAFREHAGVGPTPRRRGAWMPALTWASAAAAILALAFFLVQRQPEAEPAQRITKSPVQLASVPDPGWSDTEFNEEEGFIPFPNAPRISPDEETNLVRVELPRSSMIALGYQVNADQASEQVEADVVLGADGTARAVRFLDE